MALKVVHCVLEQELLVIFQRLGIGYRCTLHALGQRLNLEVCDVMEGLLELHRKYGEV